MAAPARFYIHIGTHKTGSTALQYYLMHNRQELVNKGILYPSAGIKDAGHHHLAWAIKNRDKAEVSRLYREINEEAELNKCTKIILSSEELEFLYDPACIQEFVPAFSSIIVFLRRQDTYLESEFNQHVKMYDTRFSGDIFRFFFHHDFRLRFDYSSLVSRWEDSCEGARMSVISYDQCRKDDSLFQTFFSQIGLAATEMLSTPPKGDLNISIPNSAIYYLARLNELPLTQKQHQRAISILLEKFSSEPRKSSLLSYDERVRLISRYQASNQRVSSQHNLPLFATPKRPERDAYETLRYHTAVNEDLLQTIARSAMTS